MRRKTVLVAGASGLVGYAAIKHFAGDTACEVIAVSRRCPDETFGARFVAADLTECAVVLRDFSGFGHVTHVIYAALYERPGLIAGWRDAEQIAVKELASKGSLHVLRHGFKCFGKTYQMAAFRPASGMNPDASKPISRTSYASPGRSRFNPGSAETVDVVLSVNGMPVVTAELKNPMSGQTCRERQAPVCQRSRPARAGLSLQGAGAGHFAVDPDLVFMTTRLEGKSTTWLPFNRGYRNGAGNPPGDAGNYRTAYLWEEALTRDSLMDILARYVHLQIEERQVRTSAGIRVVRKETMIFPRYHQLVAVRKLVDHAQANGSGHNYLIQHSAGSGKSNSIAWLAHHLAGLHDAKDQKVFDTVVVITDRLVLDQQLQDTIYQFEHKKGVVEKIDEDTQQLAKALADRVPIVISTIQKFPFIAQAINTMAKKGEAVAIDTAGRRFAVIVDEAHSSAAGETAQELRRILNKDGIEAAVAAQILDEEDDSGLSPRRARTCSAKWPSARVSRT